jgi:hypothetical protein
MTTQEIADKLVALCREGKFSEAQEQLYSENAVSIEPTGPLQIIQGMEMIRMKDKHFNEMIEEFYGIEVSDPIVADDFFSVMMGLDVKYKGMERAKSMEIAVYEVEDGKIVSEQFFYNGGEV